MIYKHKLGRKAVRHDARTFKLRAYLASLPPVPAGIDWGGKVPIWGELLNDSLGDCTCACAGHMEMLWTADTGAPVIPADGDILAAYEAIGGYNPADPSTDQGCVVLDVLNYWRQTGIAGRKIFAYAALEFQDAQQIRAAIALFGCAYFGVNLTNADMSAFDGGEPWAGAYNPGDLAGGHAIPAVAYDDYGVTFVTWGKEQRASWSWVLSQAEEAYAVLSPDWVGSAGVSPSSLNLTQLRQDLSEL